MQLKLNCRGFWTKCWRVWTKSWTLKSHGKCEQENSLTKLLLGILAVAAACWGSGRRTETENRAEGPEHGQMGGNGGLDWLWFQYKKRVIPARDGVWLEWKALVVTQRKVSGSSKEKLGFLILFHFFLRTLDFYSNSLIFENLELFF